MNRTTLIASGTAVVALGLTAWALLGPDSSEPSNPTASGTGGSKFSDRPASKGNGSRNSNQPPLPSGTARYSDRSKPRPSEESKAKVALNRLLTPAQRESIAAARMQGLGQAQFTSSRVSAKNQAVAQMREDLRTAVSTDPEGWIKTYESLNRDFDQRNGTYSGRGSNGGIPTDTPEPTEPSDPEPQTPDPVEPEPVDPIEPVEEPLELPVPIDEAQRLAEEFRNKTKNSYGGPTMREDRYKPSEP